MRPDLLVTKGPLVPSNTKIRPRNGPKSAKKPQKLCNVHQHPETKNGPYLGLRGSKPNSEGTKSTSNHPLFMVSKPQNRPTRHVDSHTSGHLVQPEGRPAHAQWGPTVGPPGSPGRKKRFFRKLFLDHLGCSSKCFWAVLSPWWRVLGHGKSQNALKMGRFGTNNWPKVSQKHVFPKGILDHF